MRNVGYLGNIWHKHLFEVKYKPSIIIITHGMKLSKVITLLNRHFRC